MKASASRDYADGSPGVWPATRRHMKGALVHSGVDATSAGGTARLKSAALFLVKLAVTAACFWYVARQVNAADFARLFGAVAYGWALAAVLIVMIETPLVALRWRAILNAMGSDAERMPAAPMIAITAIVVFVAQILPNVAADAV